MNFEINIIGSIDHIDKINGNIDAELILENGEVYTATFFTLENIKNIMQKDKKSGESANGTYFCASDMIIVDVITEKIIYDTFKDLIESDDISWACTKIK